MNQTHERALMGAKCPNFKWRCTQIKSFGVFVLVLLLTQSLFAQEKSVSGTVTDDTKQTVPGVNIIVKGAQNKGTVTDLNGNYTISLAQNESVLQFSFIGYKNIEVEVGNKSKIDVELQPDYIGLEEIVAIGYGVVRKTDITSAVSSIKQEDFNQIAVTSSPMQMVQGKIGGLAIAMPDGGDPNGEVQMQIRGLSTISGGKQPLIVIDGVPGGDLTNINPQDIESIDVLRDGSAAAIYGSRGTSGVIIVTTKNGSGSKDVDVQYSNSFTYNSPYNLIHSMNRDQYTAYQQQLYNHGGDDRKAIADGMIDFGGSTDWWDVMLDNTWTKEHQLSITKGGKESSFVASVRYQENPGVLKESYKNTLNARVGGRVTKWDDILELNMNLYGTISDGNGSEPNTNKPGQSIYRQAYQWNPTSPAYLDEVGDNKFGIYNYVGHDPKSFANPANLIHEYRNDYRLTKLLGNTKLTLQPIKNLRFSLMAASEIKTRHDSESQSFIAHASAEQGLKGYARKESKFEQTNTLEATTSYNYFFNDGLSSLEALGGYSYQSYLREGHFGDNTNFDFEQGYNNLGSGSYLKAGNAKMGSEKYTNTLVAFFGRGILNIKDRYLINGTIRREGSSLIGANNQWQNFPSASVAWKLSNESFMEMLPAEISSVKVRAGYGITGNAFTVNNVNKVIFATGNAGGFYPTIDGNNLVQGWGAVAGANENLDWETKTEVNVGLDLGLLNDRISVSFDYYKRTVDNLYYQFEYPAGEVIGNKLWTNAGSIENSGFEFNVNAVAMRTSKLNWSVNFNGSSNKNMVTEFRRPGEDPSPTYEGGVPVPLHPNKTFRIFEGNPLGDMWGHKYAGTDDNGAVLVYVKNEDGVFDGTTAPYAPLKNSDDDKQVIGNGMPSLYLNLTNTFIYGDFDFSFMLRGAFGFDVLNQPRMYFGNPQFAEAINNVFPEAATAPFWDQVHLTDYYVEKGDYVKLDNVTLGYTKHFDKMKYINQLRVYVSGKNLFAITGYKGSDPELGISTLTPGNDEIGSIYPRISSFTMGLNITF